MKKICIFLLVLIVRTSLFGQNYSIRILNIETNEPIEFVSVLNSKNQTIGFSNSLGVINLNDKVYPKDTLLLSHFNYEIALIPITELNKIHYLKPIIFSLPEVNVFANNTDKSFLKVYFKSHEYKNGTLRRVLDGIAQIELNHKKNTVSRKIIEYRSFGNKKLLNEEKEIHKKKVITAVYEGTGVLRYPLHSKFEFNNRFPIYKTSKLNEHTISLYPMDGPKNEIGLIKLDTSGLKETHAFINDFYTSGKTFKALGATGIPQFAHYEEYYDPKTNFSFLKYAKRIKSVEWEEKKGLANNAFETTSSIYVIEIEDGPFTKKGIKLKRAKSVICNEYWLDEEISKLTYSSEFLAPLELLD